MIAKEGARKEKDDRKQRGVKDADFDARAKQIAEIDNIKDKGTSAMSLQ